MKHSAELQVYQEMIDKLRQLMSMEVGEEESGEVEGKAFTSAAPELMEELGEAVEGDKAEQAEDEALSETEGYKDDMKKFFGGGKALMPEKKGLKVGVTEIAVMPKPKAKGYK